VEKSVQSLVWLLALPKSTFVQVEVASQLSTAYTDCSNITELARATVLMNKEAIIVMTDIVEKITLTTLTFFYNNFLDSLKATLAIKIPS
jgi:hypothetical protein